MKKKYERGALRSERQASGISKTAKSKIHNRVENPLNVKLYGEQEQEQVRAREREPEPERKRTKLTKHSNADCRKKR